MTGKSDEAGLREQSGCGIGPLLTKRQMANLLGVSQRTVDRWLLERRLPADLKVLISGSPRFRLDVLQRWIESGCPTSSKLGSPR